MIALYSPVGGQCTLVTKARDRMINMSAWLLRRTHPKGAFRQQAVNAAPSIVSSVNLSLISCVFVVDDVFQLEVAAWCD